MRRKRSEEKSKIKKNLVFWRRKNEDWRNRENEENESNTTLLFECFKRFPMKCVVNSVEIEMI
jgi:hypothetical protein